MWRRPCWTAHPRVPHPGPLHSAPGGEGPQGGLLQHPGVVQDEGLTRGPAVASSADRAGTRLCPSQGAPHDPPRRPQVLFRGPCGLPVSTCAQGSSQSCPRSLPEGAGSRLQRPRRAPSTRWRPSGERAERRPGAGVGGRPGPVALSLPGPPITKAEHRTPEKADAQLRGSRRPLGPRPG